MLERGLGSVTISCIPYLGDTRLYFREVERLWTPWRNEYVNRSGDSSRPGVPDALDAWPGFNNGQNSCVFCNLIAAVDFAVKGGMEGADAERAAHLVSRGTFCFLCLNAFPYSTGHILIVPYTHVDSLAALPVEHAAEMMAWVQRAELALRAVYRPAGLNFGVNLGEAGGAGIADHLHMHVLPRWIGDTNFMTVTADTRVLPEALDITWTKIRAAWHDLPR